jgi:hypothetical protein
VLGESLRAMPSRGREGRAGLAVGGGDQFAWVVEASIVLPLATRSYEPAGGASP